MKETNVICKKLFFFFAALTFLLGFAVTSLAEKPGGETAGNNLSYPVIWAEGIGKTLPGTAGMTPVTTGEWWYWWGTTGTDPDIIPLSCAPDPDNELICDDGIPGSSSGDPPGANWVKAYLQKDLGNVWQAETADWSATPVVVDWIDWGDNLESVDWYTKSMVRTEVVLYQDLIAPMLEYQMRHVSGWGINEVHGLAVDYNGAMLGTGEKATVYSHCARLTIQKLLVDRDNALLGTLVWDDINHEWTGTDLVHPPIFNKTVSEAGDGPGYYSAEINVKGKVIYGYTWNVRKLNDFTVNRDLGGVAAGDYRVTFSFDDTCGSETVLLNAFFEEPIEGGDPGTQILLPLEEEVTVSATEESDEGGGASAVLDYTNNLTYIDVRILQRTGGGGSSGNGGGKGDETWVDTRGKGAGGEGSGWGGNKN